MSLAFDIDIPHDQSLLTFQQEETLLSSNESHSLGLSSSALAKSLGGALVAGGASCDAANGGAEDVKLLHARVSECEVREALRDVVTKFNVDLVEPETKVVDVLCDDIAAREGETEDAFYVVDLDVVLRKIKEWQMRLPRVTPYFAIKSNPDPVISRIIAAHGLGFDCASRAEVEMVMAMGVPTSRILYANPCKSNSMLRFVAEVQVHRMTFDNVAELHKMKACCPEAQLVLRIAVDDSHSTCKFNSKFGARRCDIPELLSVAKQLELEVIGVSFHVGSGCLAASVFPDAVRLARATFDMAEAYGFNMTFLDIGGGFPGVDYGEITFQDIAEAISPALDECFPPESGVQIIAEPGRYFVSESHTLATCVIAKRRFVEEGAGCAAAAAAASHGEDVSPEVAYYINDGVYGSFNCVFFDHAILTPMVLQAANADEAYLTPSKLFGPTCDSMDTVMPRVNLPNLEVGDWLYFPNMGAYTRAAASAFNGFQLSKVHYILDRDFVAA